MKTDRNWPSVRDKQSELAAHVWHVAKIVPATLAYAAVIHWVYAERAAPTFGYLGYSYRPIDWHFYIFALVLLLLVAVAMPPRVRRPSDFVLWLLFILVGAPAIVVPQYSGILTEQTGMAATAGVGCAFLGIVLVTRRLDFHFIPKGRPSGTSFWILVIAFSVFVYGYLAVTTGLRIRLVGFADVYDLRDEYREDLASVGGIFGYLITWQGNVMNPLMVVRGIFSRRLTPIIAGTVGQLLLFSATGFKTIMLSVPALLLVAWLFRRNPNPSGTLLLWIVSAFSTICVSVDAIVGSQTWTSLFVRRFLLTSGMLTSTYIAFFSEQPKLYLSHSVLAPWMTYPFQLPYTRQVGLYVTGDPRTSMNANVIADGFANAGWLGVAVACVAVAIVLALVDDASRGLPIAVPATLMLLPTIAMGNSALLTALLTHGVALAVVVLAALPADGWGVTPPKRAPRSARRRARSQNVRIPQMTSSSISRS